MVIGIRTVFCVILFVSGLTVKAQVMMQAHAGNDKSLCPGDSVQIGGNPIASFATPPLSITWTPNTAISNNTIANPYVWPSSTTMYYLSITDANGRSASDSVLITAHAPGSVSLDSIPSLCLNEDPVQLSQGLPIGGWYKGTSITDSITFDPYWAGVGSHIITYYYSDPFCTYTDSATNSIDVLALPILSVLRDTNVICLGDTLIMQGIGASTYRWNTTSQNISGSNSDSISVWPDSTTFYWLVGTDSFGCSDSISIKVSVLKCNTGINESNANGTFQIFPNPFKESLVIETKSLEIRNVQILDHSGRLLKKIEMSSIARHSINSENWSAGLYFILALDEYGNALTVLKAVKKD